jgi:hypothetical protein
MSNEYLVKIKPFSHSLGKIRAEVWSDRFAYFPEWNIDLDDNFIYWLLWPFIVLAGKNVQLKLLNGMVRRRINKETKKQAYINRAPFSEYTVIPGATTKQQELDQLYTRTRQLEQELKLGEYAQQESLTV